MDIRIADGPLEYGASDAGHSHRGVRTASVPLSAALV